MKRNELEERLAKRLAELTMPDWEWCLLAKHYQQKMDIIARAITPLIEAAEGVSCPDIEGNCFWCGAKVPCQKCPMHQLRAALRGLMGEEK